MRDAKYRAKEARLKSGKYEEWNGISSKQDDDNSEMNSDEDVEHGFDAVNRRKFHEETYDSDDAEDDDDERAYAEEESDDAPAVKPSTQRKKSSGAPPLLTELESAADLEQRQSAATAMWFDNPLFKDLMPMDDLSTQTKKRTAKEPTPELVEEEDEDEEDEEEDDDDLEFVPSTFDGDMPEGEWSVHDEDQEAAKQARIREHGLHTAEAVSMAHALVNRKMTKTDLVNQGFNRHSFNDKTGLPEWFLEDENKHYRANIPISKEAVEALRARQRALDARPIKKIAEAKARKKHRAAMRLEKAQKKAEAINENSDMSEREKAENISKILAKSGRKTEKKAPQLVVARGVNRGIKGRPKGTKGRYKMVDPRMKKELRAQKRIAKRDGKKRSSGNRRRQIPKGY